MSCDDDQCSILGYYADGFIGTGSFYVATASEAPFCGDQYLFEMTLNENSPKTSGEIKLNLNKDTSDEYSVLITKYILFKYREVYFIKYREPHITRSAGITFM